jgi:L-ascorbate metabolism protein UlaG (beta-lactamase superfamily)
MKLIGEMNAIDVALLPIGDNFTMGIDDAAKAVELLRPKVAIPMHYQTFDVIAVDPREFAAKGARAGAHIEVLPVGSSFVVP